MKNYKEIKQLAEEAKKKEKEEKRFCKLCQKPETRSECSYGEKAWDRFAVPVKSVKMESYDKGEYDYEGDMAKTQLKGVIRNAQELHDMLKPDDNLPEWVQSKITLAFDYIQTASDYMKSVNEELELDESTWTKKAGQNKNGGLNEKGRKSYERENPGSDLKAPSKEKGNPRRKSFCARMKGMKAKLTSKKTARDPDSRINKSLRAWNC
jgi:hypothetical protein